MAGPQHKSCPVSPDKALKESLDQVLQSGYFDKAPAHQNGVCEVRELPPTQQQQEEEEEEDEEEEEEVPAGAVVEPSEVQEPSVEPGRVLHLRADRLFEGSFKISIELKGGSSYQSYNVCPSQKEKSWST